MMMKEGRWFWMVVLLVLLCSPGGSCFATAPPVIPVTVISGFLGSGKTTLLQHLLEHNQGLKIALVVNDVASVNIDSQLLRQQSSLSRSAGAPAGIVELQNGCACCSKSDELLASLAELVTLSDLRGEDDAFDRIVVELSGVADPRAIRSKWQEAQMYNMPLVTERLRLDTLCTVVDCGTFLDYIQSSQTANPKDSPQLFYRSADVEFDTNDDTDNALSVILNALGADDDDDDNNINRRVDSVAGLLAAQIETADVVLLNKVDLVADNNNNNHLTILRDLIQTLAGPRASVFETLYGRIDITHILARAQGHGVALAGLVDDHHDAVQAAAAAAAVAAAPEFSSSSTHVHSHDPNLTHASTHSVESLLCTDPDCTDPSHDHVHGHHHHHAICSDPDFTDPSHDHSHAHHHDHHHEHETCTNPDCTDPTHNHDLQTTPALHAGIGTAIYRARRPFHPARLTRFLRRLGINRGLPPLPKAGVVDEDDDLLFPGMLRSKGFTWLANTNRLATYWSQAGKSFELQIFGSWWDTLPRQQWPPELVDTILQDFAPDVGDRRQELVLIGLGIHQQQQTIREALDQCLLNDQEWKLFLSLKSDEKALEKAFPSELDAQLVNY